MTRPLILIAIVFGLTGCAGDDPDGDRVPDAGPAVPDRLVPGAGAVRNPLLGCPADAFSMPSALLGEDGLGGRGWTFDDVRLTGAWPIPAAIPTRWLSDPTDAAPSLRVRTDLVPAAGRCYQRALAARADGLAAGDAAALAATLQEVSGYTDRAPGWDTLARVVHERDRPPELAERGALLAALRALSERPVPFSDVDDEADVAPIGDAEAAAIAQVVADFPAPLEAAVADLVLAVAESLALKEQALADVPEGPVLSASILALAETYGTTEDFIAHPNVGVVLSETRIVAEAVDMAAFERAGQAVADAAGAALAALRDVAPFDSPGLDVATPAGRIIVRTGDRDDDWVAPADGVAVLVDLGGDDRYAGRYASTPRLGMGASVVIDVRGDDVYGDDQPDLTDPGTTRETGWDNARGFTQGAGLFGVGVLVDGDGQDVYRASVYAQGAGYFGVGVLWDLAGADRYQLGTFGQGAGYFGNGVLVDGAGDDAYGVYATGMGVGKPGGHGLALDLAGDDRYVCYHAADGDELPDAYPDHLGFTGRTPYARGDAYHYSNVCQGAGWGFRHEWVDGEALWMGGLGALVDLGDGADVHEADVFAMGMGFVYGFGFLYDGGGDDSYRSFWWGPGASAHMGVALFLEDGGDDDLYVTRASGTWGFDWGSSWVVDTGGNDRYGGHIHYGEAYTFGHSYFLDLAGDDAYNTGLAPRGDALFGAVRVGSPGRRQVGAFLDLGSGTDTYGDPEPGPANDTTWALPPRGDGADPERHLGIGIDR